MSSEDQILTRLEAGTLARRSWTGLTKDGRETACLLAAIWPEAGQNESSEGCPAELMPQWIADLTPWLDDSPSDEAWPGFVRRYAALVRWFGQINKKQSNALSQAFRGACVRTALKAAPRGSHVAACEDVAEILESGRECTEGERDAADASYADAAADAANAADASAAYYDAAADAANAARVAARAAAHAAADAAADAADAAHITAAYYAADTYAKASDELVDFFLSFAEAMANT